MNAPMDWGAFISICLLGLCIWALAKRVEKLEKKDEERAKP